MRYNNEFFSKYGQKHKYSNNLPQIPPCFDIPFPIQSKWQKIIENLKMFPLD